MTQETTCRNNQISASHCIALSISANSQCAACATNIWACNNALAGESHQPSPILGMTHEYAGASHARSRSKWSRLLRRKHPHGSENGPRPTFRLIALVPTVALDSVQLCLHFPACLCKCCLKCAGVQDAILLHHPIPQVPHLSNMRWVLSRCHPAAEYMRRILWRRAALDPALSCAHPFYQTHQIDVRASRSIWDSSSGWRQSYRM